ncbi:WD repeat-containing protein 44-like isoform X2 [Telopea speciosissima]|uniref:WD repeat-containing protein 44-like isoform X2 n=1 Tax=Telopea speciosissima TaxID=54955 RepID=UPI001CC7D4E0|nr:WD repeat-containing protein 44-like isoform X2 [Telopea speciosissima]
MMSKAGDEEEEEECFYESLDRILSSSSTSSSTSGAISEDDDSNYASELPPVPRFPMAISNYDVWIAEPSSVEERRKRLLREMGLARDPSLSRTRLKNSLSSISSSDDHSAAAATTTINAQTRAREVEFGRSVSADQLLSPRKQALQPSDDGSNSAISRSKSDGAADCSSSLCRPPIGHCNSSIPSTSADSIYSIQSVGESCLPLVNNNHHHHLLSKSRSNGSNGSPTANVASSPNKPPTGKASRRVEEIRTNSSPAALANPGGVGGGEFGDDTDDPDIGRVPDQVCTIKNLDNGKEFVVNEVREDGMWNKLREVGTGRQLTMEEFEMCVGHSPIVQELMRRQNVEALNGKKDDLDSNVNGNVGSGSKAKKKGGWFKSIKNVASTVTGQRERRSSDEKDTSSDKGGRRSSSATDDSQDVSFHGPERVRVRQYGKSCKELTALYKSQEIQAHNGSIWTIKFSLDGRYLASAGEDCIIHVWQVVEAERKGDLLMEKLEDGILNPFFMASGSPEPTSLSQSIDSHFEKKRRPRTSTGRKSMNLDHILVPETMFALSEKPICSFRGHLDDVLDLSWSKSQYLLSSSMDKTVRLWHMSSTTCLKIFSHSDYVTCIKFNPVDDRYFISGSLDAKVRIWSIPDRQVVDWNDLHEMVTAACYTPDGQGALVGSYKGTCRLYNTTENKLQQKGQIDLKNKKKKSHLKKITGFQFAPGSSSEVLITSADSRIRVIEDVDLVHKFKGFRNASSQISASLTANGKYVVCASEDSHVYVWKHEDDSRPSRSKGVTVTRSYEHFHCQDVSVAIPWPGIGNTGETQDSFRRELNGLSSCRDSFSSANCLSFPVEETGDEGSPATYGCPNSPLDGPISSSNNSFFADKISATWPEEKLLAATRNQSPRVSLDLSKGVMQGRSAWGMVIVTAGLRGEIRTFQNFGLPVRI